MPASGAPTTYCIRRQVTRVPKTGARKIAVIPAAKSGSCIFSRINFTVYPASIPAASAPRNPVFIFLARSPATNPGTIPGLSIMEKAINPAINGSISPSARPPIPSIV